VSHVRPDSISAATGTPVPDAADSVRNSAPADDSPTSPHSVPDSAAEVCPPPLNWFDVVQDFHARADAWYLDRPGYRINGKTWGQGPPLYFLNGMGGTLDLYALLVYILRDRFRCVLMDYPGLESTGAGRPHHSLHGLSDDLLAVARQCGDERFDLYATSFGSLVALHTMRRAPDAIRRAILQAGFAWRGVSAAERLLIGLGRLLPFPLRHLPWRVAIQQQTHRYWFPPFDATRWQFFVDNTGQVPMNVLAGRAALVCSTDLRPELPQIRQPVLLVCTEGEGQVSAASMRVLEEGIPRARTGWIPITGALPYLTHPHRLAKLVSEFLSEDNEEHALARKPPV
jgi:pimeloyl-ACP methyl ester carboxylesterase